MMQEKDSNSEPHYFSDRCRMKLNMLRLTPAAVIEAPSGYGKTTALQDFLQSVLPQDTPVFWFTAANEAPASGFCRLCREIDKIDGIAGQRLLKIGLPNAATVGEACDILRSIECRHEAYLIIDNFQLLQPELPLSFTAALIEHGGEGLHIIIATQMLNRNILVFITSHGILHITAADLRLDAGDIRSYFSLAGIVISAGDAENILRRTDGWIIAVYLQLRAFRETGTISLATGIITLMEYLVWDALSEEQKSYLLLLSPFEMVTAQQACFLAGFDTLPEYAANALKITFIRYDSAAGQYELHSILSELLQSKLAERGTVFERECLLCAGDYCRDNGRITEAMGFYIRTGDYDRMLSLDLSHLLYENIGGRLFSDIAADIVRNCPAPIKKKHILSMLRIAFALLSFGTNPEFTALMEELQTMIDAETGEAVSALSAEWTLLSSFSAYPDLERMTAELRKATALFRGECSRVILPSAPWFFGACNPVSIFHVKPGEADREADAFEEYIGIISRLTNGGGAGADVLFRALLAYYRGDLGNAEILAYKASYLAENRQQACIQFGTAKLLADIAMHKADTSGWQSAVSSMERAASYPYQNTFIIRSLVDMVRGDLLNSLVHQTNIAVWLQKGDFSQWNLPPYMSVNALFVHLTFLMHQGQFTRIIGLVQAMKSQFPVENLFFDLYASLIMAVGYISVGSRDEAVSLLEHAAGLALPDGLVFPLVSFYPPFQSLLDKAVMKISRRLFEKFTEVRERFYSGWEKLCHAVSAEELPSNLTDREYEVARLAADGFRNAEIAERLFVSESTIRTHMRNIFQKLEIESRKRLTEKLR